MSRNLFKKTTVVSILLCFLSLSMAYTVSAVSFNGSIMWESSSYFTFTTIDFTDPLDSTIDVAPEEIQSWAFYDAVTSISYSDQTANFYLYQDFSIHITTDTPIFDNPVIEDMDLWIENFSSPPPPNYGLLRLINIGFTTEDVILVDLYLGLSPFPYPSYQYEASSMLTSTVEPIPEPATILLLGTGLLGIVGVSRKKFKK